MLYAVYFIIFFNINIYTMELLLNDIKIELKKIHRLTNHKEINKTFNNQNKMPIEYLDKMILLRRDISIYHDELLEYIDEVKHCPKISTYYKNTINHDFNIYQQNIQTTKNLMSYILINELNKDSKTIKCFQCNKMFNSYRSLYQHKKDKHY